MKNTSWQSRKHATKTIKNLYESKETTYNEKVASKIEDVDWELKLV